MIKELLEKRKARNSYRVKIHNKSKKPILNIFKSNKNIYAQIIDLEGKVLVTVSSKSQECVKEVIGKTGIETATIIGKSIAKKAIESNVKEVVFNKGPYLYIGRVKALAEAARQNGLEF